jgi:hypothetical protein
MNKGPDEERPRCGQVYFFHRMMKVSWTGDGINVPSTEEQEIDHKVENLFRKVSLRNYSIQHVTQPPQVDCDGDASHALISTNDGTYLDRRSLTEGRDDPFRSQFSEKSCLREAQHSTLGRYQSGVQTRTQTLNRSIC